MRKPLCLLLALALGACGGLPSIKDAPDTLKLSARVVKVLLPSPPASDSGLIYVPAYGAVVPVPSATQPSATFAEFEYTLAVPGRGEIDVASPRRFSLGQCLTLYVSGAAAGRSRLIPGEAVLEETMPMSGACVANEALPGTPK